MCGHITSQQLTIMYRLFVTESEPGKASSEDRYMVGGVSNSVTGFPNIEFSPLSIIATVIEVYRLFA